MCWKMMRLFFLFSVFFMIQCTFNPKDYEPLTMVRVGDGSDTVSIWPGLTFAFSAPLQDSIVTMKIVPDPGPVYSSYLNRTSDTLILTVTGLLKGSAQYTITLGREVTDRNGEVLCPEDVLFTIVTLPAEQEPNNTITDADEFASVCCGTVYPANDTDCFYIPASVVKGLSLISHQNKSGYVVKDISSNIIAKNTSYDQIKTILFSQSLQPPVFIYIFSLLDNDSRYELGTVPSTIFP